MSMQYSPAVTVIHKEGKIDIHKRREKYERTIERLKDDNTLIAENREFILAFIRDCTLGKTILGKCKKKIGPARCLKYLSILQRLSKEYGKSFNNVSQTDMEKLVEDLENDRIRKANDKAYAEETKVDIKKTIKKFWKWKDGNNRSYPEIVEWIDTNAEIKEIPALSRKEIEKMIDHTPSVRNKALIMVLFDSGARVEELLNVRLKKEHLFWKDSLDCYMVRLEFSKTKPRTISLPLSTKYIKNWLEVHPGKNNSQSQLFPMAYPNLKMTISRIAKRVLNKKVTPHTLRHSSATYYANKLKNHYKLCYRYGWTMASNMVNRYLDREGIFDEETPEIIKSDDFSRVRQENLALKEQLSILMESQEKRNPGQKNIGFNDGILGFVLAIAKQQEQMAKQLRELIKRNFDYVLPLS
ncbi:MAG: site-specific integrase [Candidatus Zixiibacteriota bacterium]